MINRKVIIFLSFLIVTVCLPVTIFGENGLSFSTGYGLPLPFEYAGNSFSGSSSYKEVWSSFGNGVKLNLQFHKSVSSSIFLTSGFNATLFGTCVLLKSSDTFHYQDKYSQSLGGFYVGMQAVGQIRRWVLAIAFEPGIYYPYNVTVLRQSRIDDKYFNSTAWGDVNSNLYRCDYNYSFGFSSAIKLGYKISRKSLVFFSIRPSIIHARLKGYSQNTNGKTSYYEIITTRPSFAYSTTSEIIEMFPIDFSSIDFDIGIDFSFNKH